MTPAQPQPFDQGNGLLAETPAQMSTALIQAPGGQRMVLTVRTASTTMTVLLSREDARLWGRNITATADQMSAAGLVVAGATMPVNGAAHA